MLTHRQLFLNHVAQTSTVHMMLEIVKAEGVELTDVNGKKYVDLISGISVSNVGHRHPKVVEAIKKVATLYRTEEDFKRELLNRLQERKEKMRDRPGMR